MISSKPFRIHVERMAKPVPGMILVVCLTMAATLQYSASRAGTLYRCVSASGQVTLSDRRVPDLKCEAALSFPDNQSPQHQQEQPSPLDLAVESLYDATSSAVTISEPVAASNTGMVDFGDPRASVVLEKLKTGKPDGFRYIQLGDSHTAGNFITDTIRRRLQPSLGFGGLGWLPAASVRGQRMPATIQQHGPWKINSSRKVQLEDYFPFGGVVAEVAAPSASLTVGAHEGNPLQQVSVWIRQAEGASSLLMRDSEGRSQALQVPADGRWHLANFVARLPATVTTSSAHETAIGGWWMQSPHGGGATVSAAGINGATLAQTGRWRNGWLSDLQASRPDIVALAFGTNESTNEKLDVAQAHATLVNTISAIRNIAPQAAILIIGAPDTLVNHAGACGTRTPNLDAIQQVQRRVASQMRTLYFDWQQAMGGNCSMKRWMQEGLARSDGVHFSAEGYSRTGNAIFDGLRDLGERR